jgi:alpha-acetolactate decarboxylase
MPAGASRIEALRSDRAHDFTGNDLHIRVPEKSEIESLERTASIEEIHRQQITTLDIDDEFVEQKIGAQFDQVHEDALSRSPTPFTNTRTSPSHQPTRDHTASQEQVRQYTLTR